MKTVQLTAIIERERDGSSQGASIDEARTNLVEALELAGRRSEVAKEAFFARKSQPA